MITENIKRPSVRDIAAIVGVSPMTVSRSLNGSDSVSAQVRIEVMRAAEELNYGCSNCGQCTALPIKIWEGKTTNTFCTWRCLIEFLQKQ